MSDTTAVRQEGLQSFEQGQQLLAAGDVNGAIAQYMEALQVFGQEPTLYLERAVVSGQLGIALKRVGNSDEAVDYLGRAVTLFQHFPENPDAMVSMGNCFWHVGEISEEAGDFDSAKIAYNQAYAAYRSSSKGQQLQIEVLQKIRSLG